MLRLACTRPYKVLEQIVSAAKAESVLKRTRSDQHEADRAACTRGFASGDASAEPPVLKKVLRELYKRVHPDLFHDVPHAREANEHSFKLLQVRVSHLPVTVVLTSNYLWLLSLPINQSVRAATAAAARLASRPLKAASSAGRETLHSCSIKIHSRAGLSGIRQER